MHVHEPGFNAPGFNKAPVDHMHVHEPGFNAPGFNKAPVGTQVKTLEMPICLSFKWFSIWAEIH